MKSSTCGHLTNVPGAGWESRAQTLVSSWMCGVSLRPRHPAHLTISEYQSEGVEHAENYRFGHVILTDPGCKIPIRPGSGGKNTADPGDRL